ncbi:MAG: hypothetical protein IPM84_03715 [Anaerolineae bacterium]|nr:hypothetical protein [Anaerolineae bacterium]
MGRSSTSGVAAIPVLVVNQDDGQLGQALADLLRSEDLAGLLLPTLVADATGARGQVDADQAAAAVIVPAGFSDSIIPRSGQTPSGQAVKIEVHKIGLAGERRGDPGHRRRVHQSRGDGPRGRPGDRRAGADRRPDRATRRRISPWP